MMDEGCYPHMSALARAEGVTPAAVSKALLRLRGSAAERHGDVVATALATG